MRRDLQYKLSKLERKLHMSNATSYPQHIGDARGTPSTRRLALLAELLGPLLEVRELLLGHRPLDPF